MYRTAILLALVLGSAPLAQPNQTAILFLLPAQAQFVETFEEVGSVSSGEEGPENLIAAGWQFRNQSNPLGNSGWSVGGSFSAQAGPGYLGTDSLSTDFSGGMISSWVLLPEISGQTVGDLLTVHLRSLASSNLDTLQIRYSPSGSDDTGSGPTDVGDFTSLLLEVDPLSTTGWSTHTATLPGNGRIALRYFVQQACNFGCFGSAIGIDTLSIGTPPAPPCNLPPFPLAEQTATWTAAGGPYEICNDSTIVLGGSVIVEAGAVINIDSGSTLSIAGSIDIQGTAAQPVAITGGLSTVSPPLSVSGLATLQYVNVQGRVHAAPGSSVLVSDCTFSVNGVLSSASSLFNTPNGTYIQVDRSTFQSGGIAVTDGTLVLRDSDFQGVGASVLRGYLRAKSTTIDGAGLSINRQRYSQPTVIEGLTVTNSPTAAFTLHGFNHLLGSSNVIQGNLNPVNLLGGLIQGTVIPATGNINNWVDANNGGLVGNSTWAKLDVPYVIDGSATVGGSSLTILPGTVVQFTPGSGVIYSSNAGFRALGTPTDPVRFEGFGGGTGWSTLKFHQNGLAPRLDYCVVDGATNGVNASNTFMSVTRSTLSNNQTAAIGTNFGQLRARNVTFENNAIGVDASPLGSVDIVGETGANIFTGNATAVDASNGLIDARNNYWGDPSGPHAPSNPGGTGDATVGPVTVLPFETSAPMDDLPTVVLEPISSPLRVGDRVFLKWSASDNGAITSQQVQFAEHGNFGYVVLATLSGQERSFEATVPTAFPSSNNGFSFFRIVAIDDRGQEGFDETAVSIPYTADIPPASLNFTSDLSGPYVFGDQIQVSWTQTGMSGTWNLSVVADGERGGVGYGGGTTISDSWTVTMPYISTDTARIAISFLLGAGGRTRTFYSDSFTIRPDARVGDAPPVVALVDPAPGSTLTGGTVTRVHWTASDDEALRSFDLQVTSDSGRTWQTVVGDLPPAARSYDWQIPASLGFADLELRVIAHDHFFQNSSAASTFELLAGSRPLSAATSLISLSTGGSQDLVIDAGPGHGGDAYWIFGSATGPAPGLDFGGGVILPLVFDAYFRITLTKPSASVFTAYLGVLNGSGTANAALTLAAGTDPSLAGIRLWHSAAIASNFGSVDFASNAVELVLLP